MKDFERVAARGSNQHGLCTKKQLVELGITQNQTEYALTTGLLVRVQPRVYALGGTPETPARAVLASCLSADGYASHRSAAALWGVPAPPPRRPEILVVATIGRACTRSSFIGRTGSTGLTAPPSTAFRRQR